MGGESLFIGESSKVKSLLDLFEVIKILSLVIGILGFLLSAWSAWSLIYGDWSGIFEAIYWIVSAIINLMFYMKMDNFIGMLKSREYGALQDILFIWIVLTLVFGVVIGILLLIVYIQLGDLKRLINTGMPSNVPPPPK